MTCYVEGLLNNKLLNVILIKTWQDSDMTHKTMDASMTVLNSTLVLHSKSFNP